MLGVLHSHRVPDRLVRGIACHPDVYHFRDLDRLLSAVDYWGSAVWKPHYRVLSVPGLFGYVFNMAGVGQAD